MFVMNVVWDMLYLNGQENANYGTPNIGAAI